jgi:hypothetical protein
MHDWACQSFDVFKKKIAQFARALGAHLANMSKSKGNMRWIGHVHPPQFIDPLLVLQAAVLQFC